jgi:hypothetical protein
MAQNLLLQLPEEWEGIVLDPEAKESEASRFPAPSELHVAIEADGTYKIGTCEHCVLLEKGRPDRAWDAQGDKDLDFPRDRYFSLLAQLGIVMTERRAYVCP